MMGNHMSAARTKLARWRADPAAFIEHVLHNPETGEPFVLLPAERAFLRTRSSATPPAACSIPNRCLVPRRRPARPASPRCT